MTKKIDLEINDATQYATAYIDGKAVATVQRRRVLSPPGTPMWKLYRTDGTLIGVVMINSQKAIIGKLTRALITGPTSKYYP